MSVLLTEIVPVVVSGVINAETFVHEAVPGCVEDLLQACFLLVRTLRRREALHYQAQVPNTVLEAARAGPDASESPRDVLRAEPFP